MARIITVKNWDRFQHYKDRDPPWIKLYRDTLTTEAWVLGTDLSRLVQLASTLIAARYSNKIPLNFSLLKKVMSLDCDEQAFVAAVLHLEEHNFIEIHEVEDERKQSASVLLASCAKKGPERQRQSRDRGEAEKNITAGRDATPLTVHSDLDEVKRLFPKRAGSQPWPNALKAINARLAEGHTWAEMVSGVSRYADYIRVTGKERTEFVLQAATFFGPTKRFLDDWTPPATRAEAKQAANIDASLRWLAKEESSDVAN